MWSTVLRQTESCTPVGTMPTQQASWVPRKSSPKIVTALVESSVFCSSRRRRPAKALLDFISRSPGWRGALLGLHSAPDLPLGTIGLTPGLNNAAVDHFRILVHGKAAHVSTPQLGADALYAASQIVVAIQGLVARRSSPGGPVAPRRREICCWNDLQCRCGICGAGGDHPHDLSGDASAGAGVDRPDHGADCSHQWRGSQGDLVGYYLRSD